mgnify:CR=1 FL=1
MLFRSNTHGRRNTFIGYSSGSNNNIGRYNTFLGHFSGQGNTSGCYNTFIGHYVGRCNTTGSFNIFIGCCAGANVTIGANNTIIGSLLASNASIQSTVLIGAGTCERIKVNNAGLYVNNTLANLSGAALTTQKNFLVVDACAITSTGCHNT